jgi:ATP-binding cassette, subfamily B, bacterial PglK
MKITQTDLIKTFKYLYSLLTLRQKKYSASLLLLMFIVSMIELLSLALFLPVIQLASNISDFKNNQLLFKVYQYLDLNSPKTYLGILLATLLICYILKNVSLIAATYLQTKYAMSISMSLSERVLKTYQDMSWLNFQSHKEGDVMYDIYSRAQQVITSGVLSYIFLIYEVLVISMIIISIAIYNWLCLLLLITLILPMITILYFCLRKYITKNTLDLTKFSPQLHSRMSQCINGYVDSKLANADDFFLERFNVINRKICAINTKGILYSQSPSRIIETGAILAIVLLTVYTSFINTSGNFTSLIAIFGIASFRLMPSIGRVMQALSGIKRSSVLILKYEDLFSNTNKSCTVSQKQKISFNELSLKQIYFSYNSNAHVLHDLNLNIQKGEKIGFIGESGSGKSTLTNILLGFIKPTHGTLVINGSTLHEDFSVQDWQSTLGYIKQSIYISDASIMANIAYGIPIEEVDHDRVWDALKTASLDTFVKTLPNNIFTELGENGCNLSGGQKQRIGIARAIYKQPEILFMDEATSALDNKTEEEIAQSIETLLHTNLTIIIIAHRYTTLRACDIIYELKNGQIINVLSYTDLMTRESNKHQ